MTKRCTATDVQSYPSLDPQGLTNHPNHPIPARARHLDDPEEEKIQDAFGDKFGNGVMSGVGVHRWFRLCLWTGLAGGAGDVRHASLHGRGCGDHGKGAGRRFGPLVFSGACGSNTQAGLASNTCDTSFFHRGGHGVLTGVASACVRPSARWLGDLRFGQRKLTWPYIADELTKMEVDHGSRWHWPLEGSFPLGNSTSMITVMCSSQRR